MTRREFTTLDGCKISMRPCDMGIIRVLKAFDDCPERVQVRLPNNDVETFPLNDYDELVAFASGK